MSMRTKFLRFNKLPKLETRPNQTPEKDREPGSSTHHNQAINSPFRSETFKNSDFFDLFDSLLKKVQQPQNYVL